MTNALHAPLYACITMTFLELRKSFDKLAMIMICQICQNFPPPKITIYSMAEQCIDIAIYCNNYLLLILQF